MNNFRRRVESPEDKIEIDPVTGRGFIDGYEVVDLGLPSGTLWATCNVRATKETEYGSYYLWGAGANTYTSNIYHTGGNDSSYTLPSSADTATQVMGEGWKMPTKDEANELINNTTLSSVTIGGIKGVKFTSNNNTNAYVFFPFAGYYYMSYGSFRDRGSTCYVWTSTASNGDSAYDIRIFGTNNHVASTEKRNQYGFIVRGVHAAV